MLAKLTAALVAYGPLGIVVLAFIDSAGIPVASGMDALVILVAAKAPQRALLAASMGVLGSLIGNVVLFMAARTGARRYIKEVPQPGDKRRFREWFKRYGLLTIFIPCMLPIPLPLKVFVISAATFGTSLRTFVFVILAGRSIRYFGEAYLGVMLGEGSGRFLQAHTWHLVGGAVALFAVLYVLLILMERRRVAKHAETDLPK
ncbi:MAG TPA: VTT domain-containing protein [Bryobacteraceae bacterium]|jgi:membrane protein YqaA with SNARE-associated domain|nr:VTT domain-containing protein [Bryobacteraceae bacterium]